MDRIVWVDRASEQVDVRRLKQDEKARGWQPESSMRGSRWCRAPIAAVQIDLEGLRVWQTLGVWWKAKDQSWANSEIGMGPRVWQTLGRDGG